MNIDEYAIKKDIRNNPVVREIDFQQKREFLRTLCLAGLIVAMLLFSAWQHFEIVRSGYELEQLQQLHAREEAMQRKLRLELEALRAPQLIEQRATRELHMVAPGAQDTLVLERTAVSAPSKGIVADAREAGGVPASTPGATDRLSAVAGDKR